MGFGARVKAGHFSDHGKVLAAGKHFGVAFWPAERIQSTYCDVSCMQ